LRSRIFVSPTMPTISPPIVTVSLCPSESVVHPTVTLLLIGSSPGKYCLASASLMTMT